MKQSLSRSFLLQIVLAVATCGLPSLLYGFPFLRQEISAPEVIRPIPGTQTNPRRVGNYHMMMKFWHPDATKFCFRSLVEGTKKEQEPWRNFSGQDYNPKTGFFYLDRHFKGGSDRDYVFDVRTPSGEEFLGSQVLFFGEPWPDDGDTDPETGILMPIIPQFTDFITIKDGDTVEANTNIYVAVECQDPDGGFIGTQTHQNNDLNGVLSVTLKVDGAVFESKTNTVGAVAGNETAANGFGLYEFWVTLTNGEHTLQIETVDREYNFRAESNITVYAVEGPFPQLPQFGGPIRGDAYVGEDFTANITGTARDLDGDALTYSKISGPQWLTVQGDGSISGTPEPGDEGLNTFTLGVSSTDGSGEGTLKIKVLSESYVLVANDFDDEVVGSQPADFNYDTSGGFVKVVEQNGKRYLRMRDALSDSLNNVVEQSFAPQSELVTVQFRMRAAQGNDQMYLSLFDADGNCALQVGCSGNTFENKGDHGLHKYLDPESSRLKEVQVKSWYDKEYWYNYRIEANVSTHRYRFWINDIEVLPHDKSSLTEFHFYNSTDAITRFELSNSSGREGTFDVDSISIRGRQGYTPVWDSDPINKKYATQNMAYNATLADDATDADSDPLTFSKVAGPAWLTVATNGALSGRPLAGDIGNNSWTVRVSDGSAPAADAELNITVYSNIWTDLLFDDFEAGWGNWVDGGGSASLSTNTNYVVETQGVDLEANDGDASSTWLKNPLDLSGYTDLKIEFTYMSVALNSGEGFRLRFSDDGGTTWTNIQTFIVNTDFANGDREDPVIIVDSSNYNFTTNVNIRFECVASGAADDVYIDNVRISSVRDGFAIWAADNGLTGNDALSGANPDGDKLNNLSEWYIGSDPKTADSSDSILSGVNMTAGNSFEYIHDRPVDGDNVLEIYQWSTDLNRWNDSGETANGTTVTITPVADDPDLNPDADYESVTVHAAISGTVPDLLFSRLVIGKP